MVITREKMLEQFGHRDSIFDTANKFNEYLVATSALLAFLNFKSKNKNFCWVFNIAWEYVWQTYSPTRFLSYSISSMLVFIYFILNCLESWFCVAVLGFWSVKSRMHFELVTFPSTCPASSSNSNASFSCFDWLGIFMRSDF